MEAKFEIENQELRIECRGEGSSECRIFESLYTRLLVYLCAIRGREERGGGRDRDRDRAGVSN